LSHLARKDGAWNLRQELAAMRGPGESYSDVIVRLAKETRG
jgi:hypothetical protein